MAVEPVDHRLALKPPIEAGSEVPAALPTAPVEGVIRGTLLDQVGRPVVPAVVALLGSSLEERRSVGQDGSFSFSVAPGRHALRVVEDSLPDGYLPPWNQDQEAAVYADNPDFPRGYFRTTVTVPEAGGEVAVRLRAFLAATVAGTVTGPNGEPIDGAQVRIQSCAVDAPTGLASTARTDAGGRYEMPGVYPGRYRTEVWLSDTTDVRYHELAVPLPRTVLVEEGGIHELPTLVVGLGSKRVSGVVLDQDGAPFADLPVACDLDAKVAPGEIPHGWSSIVARARTNAEGRFVLEGLPSAEHRLRVGDYEPGKVGQCRAAFWIEPIAIDLRSVEALELPPVQLDESRPFRFDGTVALDAAWAAAQGVTLADLRVVVDLLDPEAVSPDAPRRSSFRKVSLDVDESSGAFTWMCETPHPPVRIVLTFARPRQSIELTVTPIPRGTDERIVHFPR